MSTDTVSLRLCYSFEAHADGVKVGHLRTYEISGHVLFAGLYVEPAHRGQGIARQLMDMAMAHYAGREIRLAVSPYNGSGGPDPSVSTARLRGFYAGYGFVPGGGLRSLLMRRPAGGGGAT